MDSSHGPHSHSHASHGSPPSIHLQSSTDGADYEGSNATSPPPPTPPPTLELPGHGVPSPPATAYDYTQSTAPNAAPTKRSNESKPASDIIFPVPKRIRVDPDPPSGPLSPSSSSPSSSSSSPLSQSSSSSPLPSSPSSPSPSSSPSSSSPSSLTSSSSSSSSSSSLSSSLSTSASSSASCSPPVSPTSAAGLPKSDCSADRLARTKAKPSGRSQSLPPPTQHRKRRKTDYLQQHHLPPVTLGTLRELDLSEIYRNPKLRHDVVFDAQLHFRPNLDGSRGRRKREQAETYWKFVLDECDMLLANVRSRPPPPPPPPPPPQSQAARVPGVVAKLPALFKTMRDILSTLVPKGDRDEVEAVLDHALLMQQLEHGVLDFKKLAQWLARVLKAHCAPMRDHWVEQMVACVTDGVDNRKTSSLVEGLKMVFGILEAMKLVRPQTHTDKDGC